MRSLQAKMFLVFALIATIPLLAMSYLALSEARGALAEEVGVAHEAASRTAAGYVDVYVENGRVLVNATANNPAVRDAFRENDRGSLLLALETLQNRTAHQQQRVFDAAILLDANGTVLAAHPAAAATRGQSLADEPAFLLPRATGALATLPVDHAGDPVLPLSAPVYVSGEFRGVLLAHLSLGALSDGLRTLATGKAEAIYLTDSSGRLIAHSNATLMREGPDLSPQPPVARALLGNVGHMEDKDALTGQPSLTAYAYAPGVGWAVVDSIPLSEAYAALNRLTALLTVLSGFLVGGILLASVVLARRIVRPVAQITEAARDLSAGHLTTRIEPRGDDEIALLGRAFNDMALRIQESLDGLRRSETRYRSLVESANDLILTIQPDGTFSFASTLSERLLGRRPADLVGRKASEAVHESDRPALEVAMRRVLEKGEPALWVPLRMLGEGNRNPIVLASFTPIFEEGERPARVLVVAHDVTEERRQQVVREKSFQMARLASEGADLDALCERGLVVMLGAVGLQEGAAYVSTEGPPRLAAHQGLASLDDGTAHRLQELARAAEEAREPVRAQLPAGRLALAIPLVEHQESLGAVVLVGEAVAFSGNTDVLRALAAQLAVGARRALFEARLREHAAQLETRVEARTAELREKSLEMEQFLYSVSHDLKAPLISIQGYAQGLQEDYGHLLGTEGAFYLDRIRKNANLMEGLILDILELSRIGRIRDTLGPVEVEALVRDIAANLAPRYAAAGGRILVQPGLPPLLGERKRLAQLFGNLLDNALKYRHPDRPPLVEVSGERHGDEAVYHIRDNGRGIPRDAQDQLFKIFHRIVMGGHEDPGGTGVGLAIVKRIAETHDGRVWVESVEGEGTTFHVALPLRGPAPKGGVE